MDAFIFLIAVLMLLDAGLVLFNLSKFESTLQKFFPNLSIKKLVLAEGVVGAAILLSKSAAYLFCR